jgi:anti-sigma factor RsiW
MNTSQDIELLSAYLDGQLNPSESARLESRLASDLEFASAFHDMRIARGVLRKLPARKAPRSFRLTRKMVGVSPPLPRTYSFFQFSSALATLLLVLTFALNFVSSRSGFGAAAPALEYGPGGCAEPCGNEPALQAPLAGAAATQAPAAAQAPAAQSAVQPTEMPPSVSADNASPGQTLAPKAANPQPGATELVPMVQQKARNESINLLPAIQIGLFIIGLVSALIAWGLNQSAKRKWK